jgi:mannose-6-phosphate isomerase-like protein (cupin superfamily)
MKKNISKCYKFNFQKIHNKGAFISVYEDLKFKVKRFYILYDLKKNHYRNGHSHKKLEQIYICVSGAIKVNVENKDQKKFFILNKPNQALFISKNTWREIHSLKKGSALCVLASHKFDEGDYIRDYNEFKKN